MGKAQIGVHEGSSKGPSAFPLVYIILLNWRGWRDTIGCLRSLGNLAYPNYRTLVVDNGSTDDSVARIRKASPDALLIETGENLGFAGGNNVGIRHALERGADYIWILNNDTIVELATLSAMVEAAGAKSRIGAVGSVLYHMKEPNRVQTWGGGRINLWRGVSRYNAGPVSEDMLHYITGASLLISREALQDVGLLDEDFFMYWEDADLGFRLRKAGWNLATANDSRVWHKEYGGTNGRSAASDACWDTSAVRFFSWPRFRVLWNSTGSAASDVYWNASAVRFFRKHSRVSPVPIIIGAGGRLLKRVARLDWKRAGAVLRGTASQVLREVSAYRRAA